MTMLATPSNDCDTIRGQWKALEDMAAQGLTRTLGTTNFSPAKLDCVIGARLRDPLITVAETPGGVSKYRPLVNQIPFSIAYHPGGSGNLENKRAADVVRDNKDRNVLVQALSPLGGSL